MDEKFVASLPDDPILAARAVCERFFSEYDWAMSNDERLEGYYQYIEVLGVLCALAEAYSLPFPTAPSLGGEQDDNVNNIHSYFVDVKDFVERKYIHQSTQELLQNTRDRYLSKFKMTFAYEFSDGDLKRIQTVLNELRDLVNASEDFDAKHKQRILRKLESLQSELHKRVSSLDKFWGLIGEAGVALGKFGKDAKPLVDRIKEITQIVWATQARAEELPSGTSLPLLSDASRGERIAHEE